MGCEDALTLLMGPHYALVTYCCVTSHPQLEQPEKVVLYHCAPSVGWEFRSSLAEHLWLRVSLGGSQAVEWGSSHLQAQLRWWGVSASSEARSAMGRKPEFLPMWASHSAAWAPSRRGNWLLPVYVNQGETSTEANVCLRPSLRGCTSSLLRFLEASY